MDRDYSKSEEAEQALEIAITKVRAIGNAYWNYDKVMGLRRELGKLIDYMLSDRIDDL